jgi:hypothetical protein
MKVNFANYFIAAGAFGAVLLYVLVGEQSLYPFIGMLLIAIFSFVFSPQINWWWYKQRPPALEGGVVQMLESRMPFYQRLDDRNKARFRGRLALIRMSTDWTPYKMPTEDDIPPDLQSAISAQQVAVTWTQPHFLMERFEKVIVSPKKFMSPNYPYSHSSELNNADDPCIMLSAEAVLAAFLAPVQHFNVTLYEYARAFRLMYPNLDYPTLTEARLAQLEAIGPWTFAQIEATIGVPEPDPNAIAIHHFFVLYDQMKATMPDIIDHFEGIFTEISR